MTVRLEELLAAATPPEHGEETYELKQRWDEFNLASQKISYLAPDAVRLLIDMVHYTRRMLQAYDGYCMWCDGWQGPANRWPRSESTVEDWWIRFEKYRAKVEECRARLDRLGNTT